MDVAGDGGGGGGEQRRVSQLEHAISHKIAFRKPRRAATGSLLLAHNHLIGSPQHHHGVWLDKASAQLLATPRKLGRPQEWRGDRASSACLSTTHKIELARTTLPHTPT